MSQPVSRREFLRSSTVLLAAAAAAPALHAGEGSTEPIIDIHQHVGYCGRTD